MTNNLIITQCLWTLYSLRLHVIIVQDVRNSGQFILLHRLQIYISFVRLRPKPFLSPDFTISHVLTNYNRDPRMRELTPQYRVRGRTAHKLNYYLQFI